MSIDVASPRSRSGDDRSTRGGAWFRLLVAVTVAILLVGVGLGAEALSARIGGPLPDPVGWPAALSWWLLPAGSGPLYAVLGPVLALLAGAVVAGARRTGIAVGAVVVLGAAGVAGAVAGHVTPDVSWSVVWPPAAATAFTGLVLPLLRARRPAPTGTRAGAPRPDRRRVLGVGAALAVGVAAGMVGLLDLRPSVQRVAGDTGARGSGRRAGGSDPLLRGTVVDVRDHGAIGDGRTDDSVAVRAALAATAPGGTLYLPAGTYRYASTETLRVGDGRVLAGDPGRTVLAFDPGRVEFAAFVSLEGVGITLDGIELRRDADVDSVVLALGAVRDLTLSRMLLTGAADRFTETYCHGILLSDRAVSENLHLTDSTFTALDYGLLQVNDSTAATSRILVEHCEFVANHNTDLEFNGPLGDIRGVEVRDCRFGRNFSRGFGVGLAKVSGAVVTRNVFDGYAMEAVHIEDYSSDVVVRDNTLRACALNLHAYVQIIGRSRGVRVIGNDVDARANTAEVFVVAAQAGGTGRTPGGGDPGPPFDVVVERNTMLCAPVVVPVYLEGARDSAIVGNVIEAPALAAAADAFRLLDTPDARIADNVVNGDWI